MLIDVDYFRRQPLGVKSIDAMNTDALEEAIQEASDFVEDYLDRKILAANYVERVVGPGGYTIILDNFPVNSLTDISYDGVEGDMGTHALSDFLIHTKEGIVEWINKRYNFRTDRVYTIQYNAGYAEVPGPVKRAVALQTVQLLRPGFGGMQAEGVDIVPFADDLITNLLERYRRKRIS